MNLQIKDSLASLLTTLASRNQYCVIFPNAEGGYSIDIYDVEGDRIAWFVTPRDTSGAVNEIHNSYVKADKP